MTTHMCPPDGKLVTLCCEKSPFELPFDDRMTQDPRLVTCNVTKQVVAVGHIKPKSPTINIVYVFPDLWKPKQPEDGDPDEDPDPDLTRKQRLESGDDF